MDLELFSDSIKLSSAQQKRIRILEAALDIVAEEGIGNLTVTALAARAKISKPLVLFHFKDPKKILVELFMAMGRMGQKYTEKALETATTPKQQLRAQVEGGFLWAQENQKFCQFFVLMYHEAATDESIQKIHRLILETGLNRTTKLVGEIKKGWPKKRIESTALALHNLMIGTIIRMASLRDFGHQKEYLQSVVAFMESSLGVQLA